jgi:hypothetical protein
MFKSAIAAITRSEAERDWSKGGRKRIVLEQEVSEDLVASVYAALHHS